MSYVNYIAMTDAALLQHIGTFVRNKRIEQRRTQEDLATASGISRSTLSLLERGEPVMLPTLIQVLRMLDQLHILDAFAVSDRVSPLVLAKLEREKPKRIRKKESNSKKATSEDLDW
jgi:transcriptional regulator with XRE-family HTH domain